MHVMHVGFVNDQSEIEALAKAVYKYNQIDIEDVPVDFPTLDSVNNELAREFSHHLCEFLFYPQEELTDEQQEIRRHWLKYFEDAQTPYDAIKRIYLSHGGFFTFLELIPKGE